MKTEVPVFKRCCFCLPVRYGILTWAYLSLVSNCLLLTFNISLIDLWRKLGTELEKVRIYYYYLYFLSYIVDFAFVFLLIVAAHRKNSRLLKIYCRGQLFAVAAYFILLVAKLVHDFTCWCCHHYIEWRFIIIFTTLPGIVYIGLQLYILAVVRSEVLKLDSQHQVRFSNIAAEAECAYYAKQTNLQADIEKNLDEDKEKSVNVDKHDSIHADIQDSMDGDNQKNLDAKKQDDDDGQSNDETDDDRRELI